MDDGYVSYAVPYEGGPTARTDGPVAGTEVEIV